MSMRKILSIGLLVVSIGGIGVSAVNLIPYIRDLIQWVQGVVDCCFEEDGRIVLLDYKTDSVSSMDELWKRYETQMDYYREALESLTHLSVSERRLYSFKLGQDKDYGI